MSPAGSLGGDRGAARRPPRSEAVRGRARLRSAALLAACAALLMGAIPAAAAGPAKSASATAGSVTATLSWNAATGDDLGVTNPALRIDRAGVSAFDQGITDLCGDGCVLDPVDDSIKPVSLVDLDGNGEPEALVNAYTGGAHCCFRLGIYDFRPDLGTYGHLVADFGNGFYALKDLDGNGTTELVSRDDRFAYAFTSYAQSAYPPLIQEYASGSGAALTDVTRGYPAFVRTEAARLLKAIRRKLTGDEFKDDRAGLVAAYVADEYLLGKGSTGLAEAKSAQRRGLLGADARTFRSRLLKFLKQTGYR